MPFVPRWLDQPNFDRDGTGLGPKLPFQFLETHAVALGHRQKLPQHLPAHKSHGKAVFNRHFPFADSRERLLEPLADEGLGQQAQCLVEPLRQDHAKPAGQRLARKSQDIANRPQAQGLQPFQRVWRQPQRRHGKADKAASSSPAGTSEMVAV